MTIKVSTGLRIAMLSGVGFKTTMEDLSGGLSRGYVDIYKGTVPVDADAAIGSATKICRVTNASHATTGLLFEAAAIAGILAKKISEVWSGVVINAGGLATFYRHVITSDDGTVSLTQPRIQGLIATAGADMNLSNTTLVNGATQTIDFYTVSLPSG